MRQIKLKAAALSLAITLSLGGITGCAGSGGGPSVSTEGVNPKLQRDEASFFSASGAKACLGGAAVGVAACLVSNAKNKLACAIAAALAGCAVAMSGNYLLDRLRADYHNLEDQLDATKEQVQSELTKTVAIKNAISETIADDEAELAAIREGIKNGTKSKADLEAKAVQMGKNLNYINANIAEVQKDIIAYQDARNMLANGEGGVRAENDHAARQKYDELNAKIDELETSYDDLVNQSVAYGNSIAAIKSEASA